MASIRAALFASLSLVAGCAAAPRSPRDVNVAQSRGPSAIDELAERVSKIRGLAPKGPLEVRSLAPAEFSAERVRLAEAQGDLSPTDGERATLYAFGLIRGGFPLEASLRAVIDEQVAGFYDPEVDRLFVRASSPASTSSTTDDDVGSMVMAHEVQHAVQDQHFGLPTRAELRALDGDERAARQALIEGDASAVMIALLADARGQPVAEVLARIGRIFAAMPPAELASLGAKSPALGHAPGFIRETLLFPYVAGTALVGELFREGGFALVDAAFARPPRTSEQVFHPEKYLEGELAVPIRIPEAPSAGIILDSGRFGELGVRIVLGECYGGEVAASAARGWGGDAYATVELEDGTLAALWSTIWDDEAAAVRFERAAAGLAACWKGEQAERWRLPSQVAVRREGLRVALVRSEGDAPGWAARLFALVGERLPPEPPQGGLRLTPTPAEARAERGLFEGSSFVHPYLGLHADLPPGLDASVEQPGLELILTQQSPLSIGALSVVEPPSSAAEAQVFLQSLLTGLEGTLDTAKGLRFGKMEPVETVLGPGWRLEGRVEGGAAAFFGMLLPACAGRRALALLGVWSDAAGQLRLKAWLESFRRQAERPACADAPATSPADARGGPRPSKTSAPLLRNAR